MKVLQVNNQHRIIGGSDTVYFNTGRLLKEHGHEVGWFAGADPENLLCEDSHFFPTVVDVRRPRALDAVRYLHNSAAAEMITQMLKTRGAFDVAHLHIYYGRLTAAILQPLRSQGVPIVQSLHEYKHACPIYTMERNGEVCEKCVSGSTLNALRYRCKGSLLRSSIAFAEFHLSRLQGDVKKIDRFICVSEFQRRILARAGIPEHKMITLYNFVDPARLAPEVPVQRGNYLFYYGRIERLKGVRTLIEAARLTGLPLRIAGTGAWTYEMQAEIADLPNVEYLGFVTGEPLRRLVARARAVVVPSEWYENCPMSVLEAKAVGTPVIGTRIGGIPELVRDGIDGFLCDVGSSEDLARAADAVAATDATDIAAMESAGKADVAARFLPQVHYRRLVAIYKRVKPASMGDAGYVCSN